MDIYIYTYSSLIYIYTLLDANLLFDKIAHEIMRHLILSQFRLTEEKKRLNAVKPGHCFKYFFSQTNLCRLLLLSNIDNKLGYFPFLYEQ